ncbi:hypothetical protein GBAR_LOCUS30809 [Geodia barretti]|uniref:Uncharacterized protein n=1 Tax=Geodia barretti TaxID=519541 RepID=A0AA35TYZ6_GEOBA|nr:hypothetical protein GBAR_LOCUS30809 [Geodia barretti]
MEYEVSLSPCLQSLGRPLVMALWYQVSYVRLGTCEEGRERGFGGDWGGTEGIGNVVQRLQNEIADLPDPSDPQQVSEYLHDNCAIDRATLPQKNISSPWQPLRSRNTPFYLSPHSLASFPLPLPPPRLPSTADAHSFTWRLA